MQTPNPIEFVEWLAKTVHSQYHKTTDFNKCKHTTCVAARKWIKEFCTDDKLWVTANGDVMKISSMDDAHLINAYRVVKRKVSKKACDLHKKGGRNKDEINAIVHAQYPILGDLKSEINRRRNSKSALNNGFEAGIRELDL